MSSIDIRRKHGRSLKEAKAAVTKTANAIAKKFGIENEWKGNTLHFRRSGVEGEINVTASEVHVHAELGFLVSALKPMIEREINGEMDKHFI